MISSGNGLRPGGQSRNVFRREGNKIADGLERAPAGEPLKERARVGMLPWGGAGLVVIVPLHCPRWTPLGGCCGLSCTEARHGLGIPQCPARPRSRELPVQRVSAEGETLLGRH